jgi:branched-chain amino acid transport system ATP-binding protein
MTAPLLSARGLKLAFGGVKAADGIDLDVMPGEFLAIIGPNGAGKTTFINMTTGYLKPQGGRIEFAGEPILGLSPRAIVRRGIGRSFQLPQLFTEHTVLENAALALAAHAGIWSPLAALLRPGTRAAAERLLDRFGIAHLAETRADALNEGARKLADIAMAVALEPRLLLMDEPTSGVAATEKMQVVETLVRVLRAEGVTAVFVEHDMEVVARFADRVAVWSQGRIAALGPPEQVLNDPAVLRDVIGIAGHA